MSYESQLNEVIAAAIPTQASAEEAAWARLDSLTKPPRSLGRVEELAARVARVQGTDRPSVAKKAILLMAGDHGVVEEGVAAYPQDVTWQMVANIVGKGAAINQFAESVGAEVLVHDVGVIRDLSDIPGVVLRKVAPGTRNMAAGPAMTREEAAQAVMVGVQAARDAVASGVQLIGTGDMGIGNTTPASALTAAFADADVAAVCGRGTGLDDDGVSRKVSAVERALAVNGVGDLDPLGVLAAVGGLEIAALAGVVIGAAEQRTCVIFDGFISGAAALAAVRMCPVSAEYLFASHRSMEPGHTVQFDALGQQPVLELDMRLGEGTGGALTMSLIDAACRMLSGMATFAEAGVDDKE
jgi:nicotinate-nucleotide--dimethylbenzimidazole phosphoribosyltransferase